jgi:hypothetical protein
MEDVWLPLDRILFTDDVLSMSCDTRDFGIYINKKEPREVKDLPTLLKYKEAFFFTMDEAYDILTRLLKDSGGYAKWRMLSFKENGNWFKYIRVIKTDHGYLIGSDFGREPKFFKRSFWLTAEVEQEHLSTH